MKALLLAAGLGTRLLPYTKILPKPLFPVLGKPVILYNIHLLKEAGVSEIMINLHHLPKQIKKYLGDGKKWGVKLNYSYEPVILETGGALKKVKKFFNTEPFIMMNSDFICDVDLKKAIAFHKQKRAIATMILKKAPRKSKYTVLGVSKSGEIKKFRDFHDVKSGKLTPVNFIGIHIFSKQIFNYFPKENIFGINDYSYLKMLKEKQKVAGFISTGEWYDIGDVQEYLETNAIAARQMGNKNGVFYKRYRKL